MKIEDVLHNPQYMWAIIDTIFDTPVLICHSAEEAVRVVIGGDRYVIKPVKIYQEDKQ